MLRPDVKILTSGKSMSLIRMTVAAGIIGAMAGSEPAGAVITTFATFSALNTNANVDFVNRQLECANHRRAVLHDIDQDRDCAGRGAGSLQSAPDADRRLRQQRRRGFYARRDDREKLADHGQVHAAGIVGHLQVHLHDRDHRDRTQFHAAHLRGGIEPAVGDLRQSGSHGGGIGCQRVGFEPVDRLDVGRSRPTSSTLRRPYSATWRSRSHRPRRVSPSTPGPMGRWRISARIWAGSSRPIRHRRSTASPSFPSPVSGC